jgi:hypothetical protein
MTGVGVGVGADLSSTETSSTLTLTPTFSGTAEPSFSIELYAPVSSVEVKAARLVLVKEDAGKWWPRLIAGRSDDAPATIVCDWDLWVPSDDECADDDGFGAYDGLPVPFRPSSFDMPWCEGGEDGSCDDRDDVANSGEYDGDGED